MDDDLRLVILHPFQQYFSHIRTGREEVGGGVGWLRGEGIIDLHIQYLKLWWNIKGNTFP